MLKIELFVAFKNVNFLNTTNMWHNFSLYDDLSQSKYTSLITSLMFLYLLLYHVQTHVCY